MCWGVRQRIDINFQNSDSRRLITFWYQSWYLHKEKESSFLTSCMANYGLTETSLFKIWWSSASTSRFSLFFLPRTFFHFLFFYEQRFFHNQEFPRMNFVKSAMHTKYGNNMKNEPQGWAVVTKIPQGTCPGPRLWHLPDLLTLFENTFSK